MFQPPRGTKDFLPEDMIKRNWIFDRLREVFEEYGYEPLGTPAFENLQMLMIKSGEDVIKQIYYFKDKSDREFGLRFEWTASLGRVVSTHRELPRPFKRYAIGPVWRYERPSEKSRREFWQADVDIVGVENPIADAEVLSVAVDSLQRLGLESLTIKINDRRILEAIIELLSLENKLKFEIIRNIDKLSKIGVDGVKDELKKLGINTGVSEKLLELINIKGKPDEVLNKARKFLEGHSKGILGCDTLSKIIEYTAEFGIREYLLIDMSLARGLDYYTGPIFEVFVKDYEEYGSIAGGGRYDEMIELFGGEPTPMTGISLGIERIFSLLLLKGVFDEIDLGTRIYVASASDSVREKALTIVQRLRRSGITTEFDLLNRSLSKQLDYTNKKKIKMVIIVGEKELKEGSVALRNMETAQQKKIKLDDLIKYLKETK